MELATSGLWVPPRFNINGQHRHVRTITIPGRGRAKVTTVGLLHEQSATQVESDERLDAIVRPRTIRLDLRRLL